VRRDRRAAGAAAAHSAALDADCAGALWALDQPLGTLDVDAMARKTLTSLDALTVARAQVRAGVPGDTRARLQTLEPMICATRDLLEAYNDGPGRIRQNR
jgi:H+/Cl- antiporter ClcA